MVVIIKTLTLAHPVVDTETDFVTQWFCTAKYSEGNFTQSWNCTHTIDVPTKPALSYTKTELLDFFPDELDVIFRQAKVTNDAQYYSSAGDDTFDVNNLPD